MLILYSHIIYKFHISLAVEITTIPNFKSHSRTGRYVSYVVYQPAYYIFSSNLNGLAVIKDGGLINTSDSDSAEDMH